MAYSESAVGWQGPFDGRTRGSRTAQSSDADQDGRSDGIRRPRLSGPGCRRPTQGLDVLVRSRQGADPAVELAGAEPGSLHRRELRQQGYRRFEAPFGKPDREGELTRG